MLSEPGPPSCSCCVVLVPVHMVAVVDVVAAVCRGYSFDGGSGRSGAEGITCIVGRVCRKNVVVDCCCHLAVGRMARPLLDQLPKGAVNHFSNYRIAYNSVAHLQCRVVDEGTVGNRQVSVVFRDGLRRRWSLRCLIKRRRPNFLRLPPCLKTTRCPAHFARVRPARWSGARRYRCTARPRFAMAGIDRCRRW